ncbi:RING finger and SPRY domain-containing protein 1-like [Dermatophagoides pteronyssinus]|uniref:RING finger and SPRY domain-containing protein 1-like n=1 Tax=Dermatophagoides pteronyssinus TaxID=6956 RepID=UPI003F664040
MGSCLSRMKHCSLFSKQHLNVTLNENQASSSHLFEQDNNSSSHSSIVFFLEDIDECLNETEKIFLSVIDTINLPPQLQRLIEIANTDHGWLKIINSMINVIGTHAAKGLVENDHIGPAVIILLLEDSQLPTRELIRDLLALLNPYLDLPIHSPCDETIIKHRNICAILSFLAEKLAGSLSVNLLSMRIIKFLEKIIKDKYNHLHVLFALNCVEKFARTNENKEIILKNFDIVKELCELEKYLQYFSIQTLYYSSTNELLKYQLGFCAQWCLDNVFTKKGRKFSYKKVDYSNLNVILNVNDKTEFLKLSPDGLSARCDTYTFECVRSNYPVSSGIYFYEVILLTSGIMQIGWATKSTSFKNHEGSGVGDDAHSIAFDGCRRVIWHNMTNYEHNLPLWNAGDIVGCLIDFTKKRFIFYLNGKKIEIGRKISNKINLVFSDEPYYAAASLMSYQHCHFNFGQSPFKYPPKKYKFKDFNSEAIITNKDDYKVIPMRVRIKACNKSFSFSSSKKNLCNICCDKSANVRLKPCDHEGICSDCAIQMEQCPFCRETFVHFEDL